jgi:hypothetical protein
MKMLNKVPIAMLAAVVILGGSAGVSSALTLSLGIGNAAISGYYPTYPDPFGTVEVSLVDATHATITFTSTGLSGDYWYAFGDNSVADMNLAAGATAAYNAASSTEAPWATTPDDGSFTYDGSAQVDGFGTFNSTWDRFDGFGYALSVISFDVTTTGSFSSDADVLTPNGDGYSVAAHIFIANSDYTDTGITGYAADGMRPIPEPSALLPLVSGLLGLGALRFRRRSKA